MPIVRDNFHRSSQSAAGHVLLFVTLITLLVITLIILLLGGMIFILSGVIDCFYIQWIMARFSGGIESVNLINPNVGKAIVSAILVVVAISYIKLKGRSSAAWIPRFILRMMIPCSIVSFLCYTIQAYSTWGHYFDKLGHSWLVYEITPDNRVILYGNLKDGEHSPLTSNVVRTVTPEVVDELEMRRANGLLREIVNPQEEDWFFTGSPKGRLWFNIREDGDIHLFNMAGYDPTESKPLMRVTLETKSKYYALKAKNKKLREEKAAEDMRKQHAIEEGKREEELLRRLQSIVKDPALNRSSPLPVVKSILLSVRCVVDGSLINQNVAATGLMENYVRKKFPGIKNLIVGLEFARQGYHEQLMEGNSKGLDELPLERYYSRIVLGTFSATVHHDPKIENLWTARVNLSLAEFESAGLSKDYTDSFEAPGAGFSAEGAVAAGIVSLRAKVENSSK